MYVQRDLTKLILLYDHNVRFFHLYICGTCNRGRYPLHKGGAPTLRRPRAPPPCPPAPLFPAGAFSHRVVWFFQVVRGSAAKFIQSAKLCSTPCRPPEGSSPADKRWEPELNAWLSGHNRLPLPSAAFSLLRLLRFFDRARSRAHIHESRFVQSLGRN